MTDEEKKKVEDLEAAIAAEKKLRAELEAKLKERQAAADDDDDAADPFPELKDHDEKIAKLSAELEEVKGKVGKTSWADWILLAFLGFVVLASIVASVLRRRSSKPAAPEYE